MKSNKSEAKCDTSNKILKIFQLKVYCKTDEVPWNISLTVLELILPWQLCPWSETWFTGETFLLSRDNAVVLFIGPVFHPSHIYFHLNGELGVEMECKRMGEGGGWNIPIVFFLFCFVFYKMYEKSSLLKYCHFCFLLTIF